MHLLSSIVILVIFIASALTAYRRYSYAREAKKPLKPGQIAVIITEKDRQEAGDFGDTRNCLLATAFRNAGHDVKFVGVENAQIGNKLYFFEKYSGCAATHFKVAQLFPGPRYSRSVVGKRFVLTPA